MSNILKKEENACSTYEQTNPICDNCVRNIGFFSDKHKNWKDYKLIGSDCIGYIERKEIQNDFSKKAVNWL
jgi:hypothetical protein